MAGIAITLRELTATDLRAVAGKTKDARGGAADAGDSAGSGGG